MPGLESCGLVQRSRWQPETRLGAVQQKQSMVRPKAKAVITIAYVITASLRDQVRTFDF